MQRTRTALVTGIISGLSLRLSRLLLLPAAHSASAQSADWQKAIWREPPVRYLLADISLEGNALAPRPLICLVVCLVQKPDLRD